MMSIKTVNALSHYTDWTIGHVHSGALGWVAMITIGAMYFMIPRLFGREIYHLRVTDIAALAHVHVASFQLQRGIRLKACDRFGR